MQTVGMSKYGYKKRFTPLPVGEGLGERVRRARALRMSMTCAECLLWQALRNHQLQNLKFRRQHPIGPYIVDFYCHSKRLVIEIDGLYHESTAQKQYDAERTRALNGLRLSVIRFSNTQIINNLPSVLEEIAGYCDHSPR
jgi:very-short-patch-repair endonuclease